MTEARLIPKPIHGNIEGDKRQNYPYVLEWTCVCGKKNKYDMTLDYVSYGRAHGSVEIEVECSRCEREAVFPAKVTLTMELK